MKKIIKLKCTNCGANIEITDKRDYLFCEYCGIKLILDDENEYVHRHIDEADMKRAETEQVVKLKNIEISEKRHEERKKEVKIKFIINALIIISCILAFSLFFSSMKKQSDQQEEELQLLVDEIKIDVANERFDDAYIKAKLIVYTEDWSSDIEEKWDDIRKEVINYIIQKEKEVTGKSTHKPEKDGFFDNLFN